MFRKSLTVAAVLAVAIGALPAPAAAAAGPAPAARPVPGGAIDGAAPDDCAVVTRAATPATQRAERAGQSRIICVTRKSPRRAAGTATGKAPKPARTSPQKPSDIRAAAVDCPRGDWGILRHEVCMNELSGINIYRRFCVDGHCFVALVGQIETETTIRSKTWPHSGNWDIEIQMRSTWADGEGHDGVYIDGLTGCEGSCVPLQGAFPSQLLKPGKQISGSGVVHSTIHGPDQQAVGHATMEITITAVRPSLPGFHTFRVGPDARCDTIASTTNGCVFPAAGLVYGLPSWEYPEVARHVRLAQNSGLVGHDVPLHRTTDAGRVDNNRIIACNPSIPRPGGLDCDEYPFASTYEGAAMFGAGHGRTFPDCGRSDLPTVPTGPHGWSACLVSSPDNRGQGAHLGQFYFLNRVLDGDDFYVEVD